MRDSQYFKFFCRKPYSPQHQTVSAQYLDGVDPHSSHQFFYFMIPRSHQVDQPLFSCFRVQPFYQLWTLSGDTPVALAGLTALAQVASKSQQCGSAHIAGVCPQRNGLYNIGSAPDASSNYQRYIVADAFVTQTLVNSRQGKLYGNSHIVPDPGGSSACATAETVDGNDVGAAFAIPLAIAAILCTAATLTITGFLYSEASFREKTS